MRVTDISVAINVRLTSLFSALRSRLLLLSGKTKRQMAIAGVEGNITYTTICLERERNEEEELQKQVWCTSTSAPFIFLACLASIS